MTKDPRYGMTIEEKWVASAISVMVLVTVGVIIYLSFSL
jgi:hypothetical protein